MYAAPIWGADGEMKNPETENWTQADQDWEALQEQAAEHAVAGRLDEAATLWAEALYLARQSFVAQDPRLAASIANHAFALRRKGDAAGAGRLFEEAGRVWDSSAPWIWSIRIERKARSSLYHLRMEAKHWKTYEATKRKRLQSFADEGRAAIAALAADKPADSRGVSRWWPEKTPYPSDSRKLLAAALLTVRINEIGSSEA